MRSLHEVYKEADEGDRRTIEGLYQWHAEDWDSAEGAWMVWVGKILQASEMQDHGVVEALRRAEALALDTLRLCLERPGHVRCPHCRRVFRRVETNSGSADGT